MSRNNGKKTRPSVQFTSRAARDNTQSEYFNFIFPFISVLRSF